MFIAKHAFTFRSHLPGVEGFGGSSPQLHAHPMSRRLHRSMILDFPEPLGPMMQVNLSNGPPEQRQSGRSDSEAIATSNKKLL